MSVIKYYVETAFDGTIWLWKVDDDKTSRGLELACTGGVCELPF